MSNSQRNYNAEAKDNDRKYAYDFDSVVRGYMMRTFEPLFPKGGKALEMGCYMGESTELIAKYFDDLTVIEAAGDLIEATRKNVPPSVKFIHSTFETVEMKEKYDAIFLVHTLEHLSERVETLAKVKTWLNDGGLLFLVVPNANAPSRQIAVKMGLITHNAAVTPAEYEHGHRITYNFDTLEGEAKAGGLKVLQRGGIFFKPLANFQFDKLMKTDIISQAYLDGCYELGMQYPDLCSSIYLVCGK